MDDVEVLKCMRKRVENLEENDEENENIVDFIDTAIKIERVQSLICGKWETMEYALYYNSSEGVIKIDEYGFQCGREYLRHSEKSKQIYELIEQYLDEIP